MRRLPWSLSWFVLTGVIFLLQLFPFTGIFLMLLAAPFWSVITVNLGFVSVAIEAAVGRISRLWLIAPVVWFGGYAIAAQLSERAYQNLDAAIRTANASQTLPFDPARSAVVVKENANDLGSAAPTLVQNYRLPVAYSDHRSSSQRRRADALSPLDPSFRAYRIGDAETCRSIRSDPRLRAASAWAHTIPDGSGVRGSRKGQPASGLCSYALPEEPSLPITGVAAKGERLRGWLLQGKVVRVTITAPDGDRIELRSGQAAPLQWFPMPVMGCALNSGAPSWDCFARFMSQSSRGLGGKGAWGGATIQVIAGALALEAASPATRREDLAASSPAAVSGVLSRHESGALANLERVLADPSLKATVHDLAGLVERPHLLAPRADAMLEAMSAALAHGRGSSETARNLQRLIAALPEADFRRVGDTLVRRLEDGRPVPDPRSPRQVKERIDGTLASRLGDLGEIALPTLERLAFEVGGEGVGPAILGLCRMGERAASLAPRLAEFSRAAGKSRGDWRPAAYVTLVRWGLTDTAELMLDDDRTRRDYARRWPGLTPGAGPEYCTFRKV
jgi:hypothetical protein